MYIYLRIYINNVPVHDLHNEVCGSKVWWWGEKAKLRSSPPPQSGAGRLERRCLSGTSLAVSKRGDVDQSGAGMVSFEPLVFCCMTRMSILHEMLPSFNKEVCL